MKDYLGKEIKGIKRFLNIINDYFIDMTYCQFDSSFPEILIIKASAAKKKGILNSCTEYPLFKWLEKEDEEN